jgi:flagellar hook assembly protein FlgD/outer membrane protein OmpA-like peptidoglycan-associated protein
MMRRVFGIAVVALLLTPMAAFCQYDPPDGGEDLEDLFSALLLAEAGPLLGQEGPQADTLNPAVSALVQRTTFDAGYVALVGLDPADGWQGHVANFGMILPTRGAVISGSAHLLMMPLPGMEWGTSVAIHGSAAKELYPGWLAGIGLRLIGGGLDRFDVGAALDLGMVRQAAASGRLRNLEWGIAFRNLGKWYSPSTTNSALTSPFTLAGGIAFDAISTEWLTLRTSASLTVPGFRNARLGLSARATLFDVVSFHGGWKIDARQLIESGISARSLIPSFGLSVTFRTSLGEEGFAAERGWTQTEVMTSASAAPLYNGVWGFGAGLNAPLGIIDTVGPAIEVDYDDIEYISPNNDGTQDALVVPITITDERFVVRWRFEVADANGTVVRTIANKDERPENAGFQSFVDRVTAVSAGVAIPPEIRWDGTSDDGSLVDDGEYRFSVSALDDNGNSSVSALFPVVVDATAPEVAVAQPASDERIFSPNDDGNKDVITIAQTGSSEDEWLATVTNASGAVVRSYTWRSAAPLDLVWDGRNDDGRVVADGLYRYQIRATDRGGNRAAASLANIIVNTESTPVSVSISTGRFSPNGDGALDTVTITPEVPNTVGIVEWSLVVRTAAGETVRAHTFREEPPEAVVFDGRDEDGEVIPEGQYFAELEVAYRNGNHPSAQSAVFEVDVTPPLADARIDRDLFSPNNDGNLDTITIFNEASREERWYGRITNSDGVAVRTFTWLDVPEQRVVWGGRQDDGRLSVDGRYFYTLESTDGAGNRGATTPIPFVIDTSDADVAVRAEFEAFSPNADGVRDLQRFFPRVERELQVASYVLSVESETGEVVRSFEGRGEISGSVTWDGTRSNGRHVADGRYRGVVNVTFSNGVLTDAQTALFEVDTVPPTIELTSEYLLFSPDGDGNRDVLRIEQSSSDEEQWSGRIRSSSGETVKELIWTGTTRSIEWAGTDEAGNAVADGSYQYSVTSSDRAGNEATGVLSGIVVDTRIPRLFVTASADGISPNDDDIRDSMSFELYTSMLDGASGWTLTIRSTDGLVVREFDGASLEASRTIDWDGRDGRGNVREGVFVGEYVVEYEKGNRATARSGEVRVDISPPAASVELTPLPFSPDNDGVDDDLAIRLSIEDESEIQGWRFEILDRNRRFFNEFSGRGMPASEIIWDGRASDGELVISAEDYPYVLTVGDELGNITTAEGLIPVDILVIRVGDRLLVQISNITFAPNSPSLVLDPNDERGAKNLAILERLAVIFEKYDSYNIRIEGHAVNVSGTEREEREELQPLSLARAQAVMDAMVEAGISARRISVVGRGGIEPVVPHTDLENRWKNRRVEFVLIR